MTQFSVLLNRQKNNDAMWITMEAFTASDVPGVLKCLPECIRGAIARELATLFNSSNSDICLTPAANVYYCYIFHSHPSVLNWSESTFYARKHSGTHSLRCLQYVQSFNYITFAMKLKKVCNKRFFEIWKFIRRFIYKNLNFCSIRHNYIL